MWVFIFGLFVFAMLALDLGILGARSRLLSRSDAFTGLLAWLAVVAIGCVVLLSLYSDGGLNRPTMALPALDGPDAALSFAAACLALWSLSAATAFVVAAIFAHFSLSLAGQHRLLVWGAVLVILLRTGVVTAGIAVEQQLPLVNYAFGGLLLFSAWKIFSLGRRRIQPQRNLLVRALSLKYSPGDDADATQFLQVRDGQRQLTPLLQALLMVGTVTLLFSLDAVPATLIITRDPVLMLLANALSLVGLRSLYFVIASTQHRSHYLQIGLYLILAYLGIGALLMNTNPIEPWVSLAVVSSIMALALIASGIVGGKKSASLVSPLADQLDDLAVSTVREGKRIVILVFGVTLLVLGVIMLVFPGPGILAILLALTVLGLEFAWARRWLKQLREQFDSVRSRIRGRKSS